jgi:hypothetical protein
MHLSPAASLTRGALNLLLAALCALVAGCGALMQVAYNNSDFALRMMADDYFDLDGAQEDFVKKQVRHLHEWHRREELPAYARIFAAAGERVGRRLDREDVLWAVGEVRERMRALTVQTVHEAVPLVATLDAGNLRALEKKLADNNAKLLKDFPIDKPQRQDRERAKRLAERIEGFTGRLSDEQRALVMRFVQSQPRLTQERLEAHKRRQREFVELLRQHRASPDIEVRLREYFVAWQENPESERAHERQAWDQGFVGLILDLDRSLTREQRRHAVKRFTAYADDFTALAREGRATADAPGAAQ